MWEWRWPWPILLKLCCLIKKKHGHVSAHAPPAMVLQSPGNVWPLSGGPTTWSSIERVKIDHLKHCICPCSRWKNLLQFMVRVFKGPVVISFTSFSIQFAQSILKRCSLKQSFPIAKLDQSNLSTPFRNTAIKPLTPFPNFTSCRCKLQSCHARRKLKTVA